MAARRVPFASRPTLFRLRPRPENPSSRTALRGAIGSARVWDEHQRLGGGERAAGAPAPLAGAPDALATWVASLVRVALDARPQERSPEARRAFARQLETRLLALLAGGGAEPRGSERARGALPASPPPAPEPEGEPAAPSEDVLPAATPPVAAASPDPRVRALAATLARELEGLGGTLAQRADLRARLIDLALAAPAEGASADDAPTSAELRGLDLLQRRAAKLEQALGEARAALAHVATLEHVDPGLPSIYRTVQGLSPDDPRREQKRGALERVFHANFALQKRAS